MYDRWISEGQWHVCDCGERWCDADGGPCHWTCDNDKLHEQGQECDCEDKE